MTRPAAAIRPRLRRIYENNRDSARAFGIRWAVTDFQSRINHLNEHPRGPLTKQLRHDAADFGLLEQDNEEQAA